MTAIASLIVKRRASSAFSVEVQLPGSAFLSNVPKWRWASAASSDFRLPGGPTIQSAKAGLLMKASGAADVAATGGVGTDRGPGYQAGRGRRPGPGRDSTGGGVAG